MARISKERQEEIRKKIKEVAKQKFSDIGYDKVSTKEIAKEVGIAEGTLFNYFDSKTEIFFEAFGDDYDLFMRTSDAELHIGMDITDQIVSKFQKGVGMVLRLPKGILGELAIASVKMAKKKPDRFKRLMEYDLKFIEELTEYTRKLIAKRIIREVDAKHFSEIIFAIIGYELLLYMYDVDISKEKMKENTHKKIDILIQGYIKGGQS